MSDLDYIVYFNVFIQSVKHNERCWFTVLFYNVIKNKLI